MSLATGARLGPYEITAPIGAGGMGEVYRARDTTLGREVAIKILPEHFAADPERIARFEREAKALAALNHPNIAQIYGLEDGRALVMELVEGDTLADRIARGAIPLDEALPLARQIAEALEAAHEQGIVHRDLKPANIKVRDDGAVKVLDFGLAKLASGESAKGVAGGTGGARGEADLQVRLAESPTITSPALITGVGVLLGTAAYMSPEQAKGRPADRRSDIWAFGCVLYEMLAGRRAFDGEDATEVLGAVLRLEPNWSALPSDVPRPIRTLLEGCLVKDRRARVADISTARFVLGHPERLAEAPIADQPRWTAALLVAAGAAGALGLNWLFNRPAPAPVQRARFVIATPDAQPLASTSTQDVAVSPDGRHVVYVARIQGQQTQLAVRPIDSLDARLLPGTEGAFAPFISPDGASIGFFVDAAGGPGELRRMPIGGGPSFMLCRCSGNAGGASWGEGNRIVFATTDLTTGLFSVPSAGGEPTMLTTPDRERGEVDHRSPFVLPGGSAVLYTIFDANSAQTAVLDLNSGQSRTLFDGSSAQYTASGQLVYATAATLRAVPFDVGSLRVTGDAVPVVEGVRVQQASDFSVSRGGALVYVGASAGSPAATRELVWVTRKGAEETLNARPRPYVLARLSPDGSKLALDIRDTLRAALDTIGTTRSDIWIWDFERESLTPLTSGQGNDRNPVWTPDGRHILFASDRGGSLGLYRRRADGTGPVEPLSSGRGFMVPTSTDGTRVVLMENLDISFVTVPPAGGGGGDSAGSATAGRDRTADVRSQKVIATAAAEDNGELSPDGRWLAYSSTEPGQSQVFVRSFPNIDDFRLQISTDGGRMPAWAPNGRELFYLDASDRLTSVPVTIGPSFRAGKPARVLDTGYFANFGNRSYDISPDGQRFLMIKEGAAPDAAAVPASIIVVLNWQDELRRLAPR